MTACIGLRRSEDPTTACLPDGAGGAGVRERGDALWIRQRHHRARGTVAAVLRLAVHA